MKWVSLFLIAVTVTANGFCQNMPTANQGSTSTTKMPIDDPDLTTFAAAVKEAGLTEIFKGTGPFTAFVPSNEAFQKMGKRKLDELMQPKNKDELTSLIIYHIVPGKYLAKDLDTEELKTINGKPIAITVLNDGQILVNDAKVVRTDLVGPNGVLHIIDTVLIP